MGENHFAPAPMAVYGFVLLMNGIAYAILTSILIKHHGDESILSKAVGSGIKGKISCVCYAIAIPCAFVHVWISGALYILVALIWLVPDKRIENVLHEEG
ncbi:hypothetical protein [Pedobacter sp. UC225_65]|uniref:hypothetical protein n=1 Tax=Pedobacter sp. UC225_65 TaxID=3350173 RepID=UPI00366FD9DF